MNRYNFDQMIDRRNTDCVKYDGLQAVADVGGRYGFPGSPGGAGGST